MVKIIGAKQSQNVDGKPFVSLKLQGGIEAVQSQETGKMYLTARTCWIPSTFDVATAKSLIGQDLPGSVQKVATEPYEYTIRQTGEVIMLSHKYEFFPIEEQASPSSILEDLVSVEG